MENERDGLNGNDVLIKVDNTSEKQITTIEKKEFNYPWLLINAIREPKKFFGSNFDIFKKKYVVDRLILLLAFVIFMFSFLSGIIFYDTCYCGKILSLLMITQGSCGLIIILIKRLMIIFSWKPENMMHYAKHYCYSIKTVYLCSQGFILFCIICFSTSQFYITVINSSGERARRSCFYDRDIGLIIRISNIIALILHYIIAVIYLWNCVWNDRRFLRCISNIIETRLKNCDEEEKLLGTERSKDNICTA